MLKKCWTPTHGYCWGRKQRGSMSRIWHCCINMNCNCLPQEGRVEKTWRVCGMCRRNELATEILPAVPQTTTTVWNREVCHIHLSSALLGLFPRPKYSLKSPDYYFPGLLKWKNIIMTLYFVTGWSAKITTKTKKQGTPLQMCSLILER